MAYKGSDEADEAEQDVATETAHADNRQYQDEARSSNGQTKDTGQSPSLNVLGSIHVLFMVNKTSFRVNHTVFEDL